MPTLRLCGTIPPLPHMSSQCGDNYPFQCTLLEVRTLKKKENMTEEYEVKQKMEGEGKEE
jgi:hypothetical protein